MDDITNRDVLIGGAGAGTEIVSVLPFQPAQLHAVDLSSFVLDLAETLPGVRFCRADICRLPFASGSFDLIVSGGVIQATPNPRGAVLEMTRTLKPGGILTIGNHYPPNLHNRRVTAHRERRRLHDRPRTKAKAILQRQSMVYYALIKTRLWRLHRRFPIPGLLEFCNIPGKTLQFYYANACDYYLCTYRHMIGEADLRAWANEAGVGFERTPKGGLLRAPR